jgi:hypothetical protein
MGNRGSFPGNKSAGVQLLLFPKLRMNAAVPPLLFGIHLLRVHRQLYFLNIRPISAINKQINCVKNALGLCRRHMLERNTRFRCWAKRKWFKVSLVLTMLLWVTRSIHTAVCWVEVQRPLQVLHPAVTRNGTSVAWHTGYNAHVRCAHIKKTRRSNWNTNAHFLTSSLTPRGLSGDFVMGKVRNHEFRVQLTNVQS